MKTSERGDTSPWKVYAVIVGALAITLCIFPLQSDSFGTIDFIQYWSAWQLMTHGQNPYDPTLLHQTEEALRANPSGLIYSWNPPWTFTLLAPFLALPFTVAATAWCLFQVSALFFIATKAPRALKMDEPGLIWTASATLIFLPSLYSIQYGQLGILFALSVTAFLLAVNNKAYGYAGLSLLPLSVKPHLFFLCVAPCLLWLTRISPKERNRFLLGGAGGFALLITATLALEPSLLVWWLDAMTGASSDDHLTHFQHWKTNTTVTAVRLLVQETSGLNPSWPLVVIPGATFIATFLYFCIRRPVIEWPTILPPLLCLSLATSSYGWIYDQAVLVLCPLSMCALALSRNDVRSRGIILFAAISPQILLLISIAVTARSVDAFFVLPWVYLILLLIVRLRIQKGVADGNA